MTSRGLPHRAKTPLAAAMAIIGVAAFPAFAEEDACLKYAGDAVTAAEWAYGAGCDMRGPRWSRNFGAHVNWCSQVSDTMRASETNRRRAQLNACAALETGAKMARCRDYAARAVSQNKENIFRACGFSGSAWHNGRREHQEWCLEVSAAAARRQTGERAEQLSVDCPPF